jgi:histidine triad (HIT) family protein
MSIFTKIINNEIQADKVYEDELIIAIKDIAPKAPVHILIIPKKAYPSMQDIPEKELHIMQKVVEVAQFLAKKFSIAKGYRFISNVGKDAGQEIQHLHFHLIGGKKLGALV